MRNLKSSPLPLSFQLAVVARNNDLIPESSFSRSFKIVVKAKSLFSAKSLLSAKSLFFSGY